MCPTVEEAALRRRKNKRHKEGANTITAPHSAPHIQAIIKYAQFGLWRWGERSLEEIGKQQDNAEPLKTRKKGNFKRKAVINRATCGRGVA